MKTEEEQEKMGIFSTVLSALAHLYQDDFKMAGVLLKVASNRISELGENSE